MSDRPNILLIVTDQHRLEAVGAYGDTPCQTPHIDRLAERGTRFENVYTTYPVCSPARGTIMTGQWPMRHGITANTNNLTAACHHVRDSPNLLPRKLQARGYRTGYTGKWHLGDSKDAMHLGKYESPWPHIEALPRDYGFDGQNFPGHGAGGFQYPEYKQYLKDHGFTGAKENGELTEPVESTVPYFLTSHTISLIDQYREAEEPFFIWHNFWGPHGPYLATKEYNDIYRDMDLPPWPNFDWPAQDTPGPHQAKIYRDPKAASWRDYWQRQLQRYYAFTTMIDDQIGRMLQHLEETGLAENTVVIFCADHGETLGSHGGLTDKGYHHFEEIQRIPLIVRGPGVREAQVRDELISLADLMPTVCDLAGDDAEHEPIQGRSFAPLLKGQAVPDWREDVLIEFDGLNNGACTIRTLVAGRYKYGLNLVHQDELYDLEADPWETRNLIADADHQALAQRLRERIFEWMQEADDQALAVFRSAYPEARPGYQRQ